MSLIINENCGSRIWFSSDYHFGHANIIKYCNRPFKDVVEMEDEIIRRHNEVVKKTDVVICLGDISFQHSLSKLNKMNGVFFIVRGNHDDKHIKKIAPKEIIVSYYNIKLFCTHKPCSIIGKYNLNIVGHVHDSWKYKEDINALNVCVEMWDYYPVPIEEILKYCK
jgi:calcineurin-like phosphoesterase family protein